MVRIEDDERRSLPSKLAKILSISFASIDFINFTHCFCCLFFDCLNLNNKPISYKLSWKKNFWFLTTTKECRTGISCRPFIYIFLENNYFPFPFNDICIFFFFCLENFGLWYSNQIFPCLANKNMSTFNFYLNGCLLVKFGNFWTLLEFSNTLFVFGVRFNIWAK